jgi:oligopeptide transport system substrate-binding protein
MIGTGSRRRSGIGGASGHIRSLTRSFALSVVLSASACLPVAASQTLRLGNGPEPESLDPQRAEGVSAGNILRDLYEGLTAVSASGAPAPGAASGWERSDDGLDYVFHLRPEARWSDGDAVTAEDFVAGLRRTVDPATASVYAQMLAPIENAERIARGELPPERLGVEALDPHTLRLRLKAPAPYVLGLLSHPSTFPIHRPSLDRYGPAFARPGRLVSNGAYRLVEWTPQARVVLERNPYYWDTAHTAIDRVIDMPTEDLASELKRYRAGELDVSYAIPMSQARWIRQALGEELHLAPYLGSYFYGFNIARPPFANAIKLRQALSLAIDREVIAEKVLGGTALPAYGFVPPGIPAYVPPVPEWAGWPRERRIAEAQRLYAESGYSSEHPLEVELRYNTQEDHRRIAIVVAAMWKQRLGVRTHLLNEEFRVFLQKRKLRRETQVFRSSWIGDYLDAGAFLAILRSDNGHNDYLYSSAEYDALLDRAALEADADRRNALLEQAERLMLDQAPILPIFYYRSKHLVKPYVDGWQDNPLDVHYSKNLKLLAR